MKTQSNPRNLPPGLASISALDLVSVTMEKLKDRHAGLPGLGVLYGPAGWGKSMSAGAMQMLYRAYYLQIRSAWTRKSLLEKILVEMGVAIPKGKATIPHLLDLVCAQLSGSMRPLVLDEFDYCTRSDGLIEIVRDIYEGSRCPILLVGEELLPQKLASWERFHSRVLAWAPAQPVSINDAAKLAPLYCAGVSVTEDLLAHLVALSEGSVRRVCVNLSLIRNESLTIGEDVMSLVKWGGRELYTGEAPVRGV